MRKLSTLLIVIAVVFVGIGFYRGWFVLSTGNVAGSNKVDVNLTVDPDKVKADAAQVTPSK